MPLYVLLTLVAVLTASCSPSGLGPDGNPDFGTGYNIVQTDDTPALIHHHLSATLEYSVCANGDGFELRRRTSGAAAEIWFQYQFNGAVCSKAGGFPHTVELPGDVLARDSIVLLAPDGRRFNLRLLPTKLDRL